MIPVLIASGERPTIAVATSSRSAGEAAEALAALGEPDRLQEALRHPFAGAREVALRALAPPRGEALPEYLLALRSDPGSRVRLALVDLLARSAHPSHKWALLRLPRDEWSSADAFYDEAPNRLIAQRA